MTAPDRPSTADLQRRFPAAFPGVLRSHGAAAALTLVLAIGVVIGFFVVGVPWSRFLIGLARLGDFLVFMLPPSTGTWATALVYLRALGETIAIALLGTLVAAILALPAGLLAARNIVANRILHFLSRRMLDSIRGIDELIWALVWINVVGLGPFAGVMALVTANFGAFGKLYSEAIEAVRRGPVEGVVAAGGSAGDAIRFGVLPQVVPVLISQVLYYFESNTRSATIIGIVGAGGIGLHLAEQIRMVEFQQVSALILMILVTVAAIDALSSRLRLALIGLPSARA
jgi:phosphonate transport system permease protein